MKLATGWKLGLVAALLATLAVAGQGCTAIRIAEHNAKYQRALRLEALHNADGHTVGAAAMVDVGQVLEQGPGWLGALNENKPATIGADRKSVV